MRSAARLVATAAIAANVAGCVASVHESRVLQGPMRLAAANAVPVSVPAVILLGDMHLPPFVRLPNTVYFVAVSRDRLRFHVEFYHRWDTIADVETWQAWLEDDDGFRLYPQAKETATGGGLSTGTGARRAPRWFHPRPATWRRPRLVRAHLEMPPTHL